MLTYFGNFECPRTVGSTKCSGERVWFESRLLPSKYDRSPEPVLFFHYCQRVSESKWYLNERYFLSASSRALLEFVLQSIVTSFPAKHQQGPLNFTNSTLHDLRLLIHNLQVNSKKFREFSRSILISKLPTKPATSPLCFSLTLCWQVVLLWHRKSWGRVHATFFLWCQMLSYRLEALSFSLCGLVTESLVS